jgi:hypothetical protein
MRLTWGEWVRAYVFVPGGLDLLVQVLVVLELQLGLLLLLGEIEDDQFFDLELLAGLADLRVRG